MTSETRAANKTTASSKRLNLVTSAYMSTLKNTAAAFAARFSSSNHTCKVPKGVESRLLEKISRVSRNLGQNPKHSLAGCSARGLDEFRKSRKVYQGRGNRG